MHSQFFFSKEIGVVFVIIFTFGRNSVKSVLSARQKLISSNINQAQNRLNETEKAFLKAQKKYKKASELAKQIEIETQRCIENDKKQYQAKFEADVEQLKEYQQLEISNQYRKIKNRLFQKILINISKRVKLKFQNNLNEKIQKWINMYFIEKLTLIKKK